MSRDPENDDRRIDEYLDFSTGESGWRGLHDDPVDEDTRKRGQPLPWSLQQIHAEMEKLRAASPWERFKRHQEELRREKEANRRLKVTVDGDRSEITLDGKTYPVEFAPALFVDIMVKARTWVSGPDFRKQQPVFFDRPERMRDQVYKMVPPLAGNIESSHKGYRLKSELLE